MTKRALGILLAVTAIAVFATIVIASSLGEDDQEGSHMMPSGQTMRDSEMNAGEMGSTEEMGSGEHMMPNGEAMDGGAMNDGEGGDEGADGGGSE